MHVKQLGQRMSESVLTEIILSVIFGLIKVGDFFSFSIYYAVSSAGFFCFYTIWMIMAFRTHAKRVSHRKTYYVTNLLVIAILAVPSIVLGFLKAEPYYYFLFYPFAAFKFLGLTDLPVSTLITNGILFLCYIICPMTVKRKRRRKHSGKGHGSGPVDTSNFIMKV